MSKQQTANSICYDYFKEHNLMKGIELEAILEDSLKEYTISVTPNSTHMLGGGGTFKISKQRCEIIEVQLFQ